MQRRPFLLAAFAAFALTACGSAPESGSAADSAGPSARISVVTRGEGPDIVLIHGLAANRDVWAAVADSLDERYTLHIVQINGFGGAPPGPNAQGPILAPVAEEIAGYIRESHPSGVAVIGHSLGGTLGMMVATRHPATVTRLMVVDAPPFIAAAFTPPGTSPDTIRAIADQTRESILATPPGGSGMLEQMIPTMTRSDTAKAVLLQYARDSHRPTVANAMHELIVTDLRPDLGRITAPLTALYVMPANLPMKPADFDRVIRASFANAPRAHLVRIDNSNHYIHIDRPGRFVTEVDAFMKR